MCFFFIAVICLGILAVAGFIVLTVISQVPGGLGRSQKMQAAATRLGWTYVKQTPYTSIAGAASLHLFAHGSRHRVANILSGPRDGVQMSLFDHQFQRSFVNRYFLHTVVVTPSNVAGLPNFVLRSASFLSNLGVPPSHQITFPSHPGFSAQFVVMGEDGGTLRRIFTDAVLEYCEMHAGLCVESAGGFLFVFRQGLLIPAQSVEIYLDEPNILLRLFAFGISGLPAEPPPLPPPPSTPLPASIPRSNGPVQSSG